MIDLPIPRDLAEAKAQEQVLLLLTAKTLLNSTNGDRVQALAKLAVVQRHLWNANLCRNTSCTDPACRGCTLHQNPPA